MSVKPHHGIYDVHLGKYLELPPRLRKPMYFGKDGEAGNLWACTEAVPAMLEQYRHLVGAGLSVRIQPIDKATMGLMRGGMYD